MRLERDQSIGLAIDIQERLHPHMHEANVLERNCVTLFHGLGILSIPILATEQYPKGLGPTIPAIRDCLGLTVTTTSDPNPPLEKVEFSCWANESFASALRASGKHQVIIAGIEAHVCVLQTALELTAADYDVVVAFDCTSSRRHYDADIAYRRMEAEGVRLGTYESILLELCRVAGTDTFRAISKLIK